MKEFAHPKLRDSKKLKAKELYPLGDISDEIIRFIGGEIIYMIHTGRTDLSGDDWGDIFSRAINGEHFKSPIGVADVAKDNMAWSMKTVKGNPQTATKARLISGRCSPDYSYNITDPHEDIQRTGTAVLNIWNERINLAYDNFNPVRVCVLIRSDDLSSFEIYEEHIERYRTSDVKWKENKQNNLEGYVNGVHRFTWQPHGSQFTIISEIPKDAIKFKVRRPSLMNKEEVLRNLEVDESWIEIERPNL